MATFCSTRVSCVLGSALRSCIQNLPILGILVDKAQLPRSSYKRPTWWPSSTELSTRLSNSWEEGARAEKMSVGQNAAIWMKTRTSCSFVLARSQGQIQYFYYFFCSLWQCTLNNEITRFAFWRINKLSFLYYQSLVCIKHCWVKKKGLKTCFRLVSCNVGQIYMCIQSLCASCVSPTPTTWHKPGSSGNRKQLN